MSLSLSPPSSTALTIPSLKSHLPSLPFPSPSSRSRRYSALASLAPTHPISHREIDFIDVRCREGGSWRFFREGGACGFGLMGRGWGVGGGLGGGGDGGMGDWDWDWDWGLVVRGL